MKKNNFIPLLFIILILVNGCASTYSNKYKDSKMVFRIDVDEPQIKETKQQFYLINKKVTVLPFIDNRNFEKALFATDIPLSILFSKTLYKILSENLVFKKTELVKEEHFLNKSITFDENNFSNLKTTLKTDAVVWGIIYEFDIVISEGKEPQHYILTLHARGDIKIMEGSGIITYYHDFNKTRSYSFKTDSPFSYTIYDVKSLGPFINNFCEWIVDGESNHFIANSEKFTKGTLAIENIMPDVLNFPQENTKLYDASIITSAIMNKTFFNAIGTGLAAVAGFYAGYYLSGGISNNLSSALLGLFVGMPVAGIAGFFIINYFTDKMYEENERKAIFYALNNKSNFTLCFPIFNLQL